MKIRLIAIPPNILSQVRPETDALRRAVNVGDMDAMEAATETLVRMTNMECSVDFPENQWRKLQVEIETKNPTHQSDYLLPGEFFTEFFPGLALGTMVLQLPIDEE